MDTIFMNSNKSKTSESHILLINLSEKIDFRRSDKYIALSNFSIYFTLKNIKKSYKNNKFKILCPAWHEKLELSDGSYSVSTFRDYFNYINKKHEKVPNIPPIRIYVNKIENKIIFEIKKYYYLELLTPETMKLLGNIESKITKNKNDEDIPHLEIIAVILVHYIIVKNDYLQEPRVLYTFVPNKYIGQL